MTVGELIKALQAFPEHLAVNVVDGYQGILYNGDWEIKSWEDFDGKVTVDIGVGGTLLYQE